MSTKLSLKSFIPRAEYETILKNTRGEEGNYFLKMLEDLKETIATMPETYDTDGQGNSAKVMLHYFHPGGSDWWLTERDSTPEQNQAFGFVCLNGDTQNAELGYVSIAELLTVPLVELDLYWTPKTIGEVKKGLGIS